MRRALTIAARGITSPNPRVGCVIVKDGDIIGEGFHPLAGEPHAEVFALRSCSSNPRGATVYVTLEPCSHFGRTPPCADALIEAGIHRVIAAVEDPNPSVAGSGLARLRNAGVETSVGLLSTQSEGLNRAFFHFHRSGRPMVTLKCAMTLDGRIATRTGDSQWITSEKTRRWVHRERANAGAVLCGIGTVLADDPMLTARTKPSSPRQPLRVIMDPQLRIPIGSRLVSSATNYPLLVFTSPHVAEDRRAALAAAGANILSCQLRPDGKFDLHAMLQHLAKLGCTSIIVEGGAGVHASFIEQKAFDEVTWHIAPKFVGSQDAPGPVAGIGVEWMRDAHLLTVLSVRRFGDDVIIQAVPRLV